MPHFSSRTLRCWNQRELKEFYSYVLSSYGSGGQEIDDLIGSITILLNALEEEDTNNITICKANLNFKIGDAMFAFHDYESAYSFYRDAFDGRRNALGDANLDTIRAAYNTGKSLHCLGKSETALRFYSFFVQTMFSSPTNTSNLLIEETVMMINSIAWAFHQELSFNHATAFYKLTLRSVKQLHGENHKKFSRALNQFGNMLFASGDTFLALQSFERSLKVERALLKEQNVTNYEECILDSLTSISNIASTLEEMGSLDRALAMYQEMEAFLGSPEVLCAVPEPTVKKAFEDTLQMIARIQGKLGHSDQAIETLVRLLEFQKQEHGNDHLLTGTTFNEIGIIHEGQGHIDKALENFEESLRIRRLLGDPGQGIISTVLLNIAILHIRNGENANALSRLKEIVTDELSSRTKSGVCDFAEPGLLLDALELMANIFTDLNEYHNALYCFDQGIIVIIKAGPGIVEAATQSRFLGMAGSVCLKLNYVQKAMNLFAEAMRVNHAGGLAFNANISSIGYDLRGLVSIYPSAAAAAA